MNEIPRVVFDTNILFSAVGWPGNPHQCVQAARRGKCLSVTCEAILANGLRVPKMPKPRHLMKLIPQFPLWVG